LLASDEASGGSICEKKKPGAWEAAKRRIRVEAREVVRQIAKNKMEFFDDHLYRTAD
jgi:hypothetical protein